MKIKDIKEDYPDIYEIADKKMLSWISKNKKVLTEKFKNKYPKSPFNFVAQFLTSGSSFTVNDVGEIKKLGNVSFLSVGELKKMGCPISK